jgi:Na+:H+ antiporter, NhaA family
MIDEFRKFLKLGSAGGILLLIAAVLAMLAANTPLNEFYRALIEMPVEIRFGPLFIGKPLLLWINDGLMAVFFFLIGLELKRELLEGELSNISAVVLPAIGALGGMLVPPLVYLAFNAGDPQSIRGWAVPAATDIAFSLGILALLGTRVPVALKVFLVSLAIFDDVGAILIIAFFYTSELSSTALTVSAACIFGLTVLNRRHVTSLAPYMFIGLIMWISVLKSGVHATLAGVVLALFIPLKPQKGSDYSPSKAMEHDLHGLVTFAILPIFAFANAGVEFVGVSMESLLHPVPLGIAAGLFLGKQAGIFGLCFAAVKMRLVSLPKGVTLPSLYGVSLVCGVGFTMSLFISGLAFEAQESRSVRLFDERLGIIFGSLLSGLAGYFVLNKVLPKEKSAE